MENKDWLKGIAIEFAEAVYFILCSGVVLSLISEEAKAVLFNNVVGGWPWELDLFVMIGFAIVAGIFQAIITGIFKLLVHVYKLIFKK